VHRQDNNRRRWHWLGPRKEADNDRPNSRRVGRVLEDSSKTPRDSQELPLYHHYTGKQRNDNWSIKKQKVDWQKQY